MYVSANLASSVLFPASSKMKKLGERLGSLKQVSPLRHTLHRRRFEHPHPRVPHRHY